MKKSQSIYTIALTGGPCGGKTSSLKVISEWLTSLSYKVFIIPEMATLFYQGGVSLTNLSSKEKIALYLQMSKAIIALEKSFLKLAKESKHEKIVILCDRGVMDSKAYLSKDEWKKVIKKLNSSESELRDNRYDGVFHLVTAAAGAKESYSSGSNIARSEDAAQALELDEKTKAVWIGHPHLRVINSFESFEDKISQLKESISRLLGIPEPIELEKKWLIKKVLSLPLEVVTVTIEQSYLHDGSRVRKREQLYTHTLKEKRPDEKAGVFEHEKRITKKEYFKLLKNKDPFRGTIKKERSLFLYQGNYFELDHFLNDELKGLIFLELEFDGEEKEVELPSFLEIIKDVSEEKQYKNSQLSMMVK